MTKLNQIVALEKGLKARTNGALTLLYRQIQDHAKLSGLSRTYQPKEDGGDQLPAEGNKLQLRAEQILAEVNKYHAALLDLTLTKDIANTTAKADIVVDDVTVASAVPVTYLLFLEKQLQELAILARSLPVLDPAETWAWAGISDCFRSEQTQTTRSKKVPRNHVKSEATREHPAQVEIFYEDVIVGTWTQIKQSGAMEAARVHAIQDRVMKLMDAVKTAREAANLTTVVDHKIGQQIYDYLLSPNL